jgi:hypothetical protein
MTNCVDGGCVRCQDRYHNKRAEYDQMTDRAHTAGAALDRCICVHAEQNALLAAARFGTGVQGATLYTTLSPCFGCLKEAIQARSAAICWLVAICAARRRVRARLRGRTTGRSARADLRRRAPTHRPRRALRLARRGQGDQDRTTALRAPPPSPGRRPERMANRMRPPERRRAPLPECQWSAVDQHAWRNWARNHFRPAAAAAGVEGARPYDLRHSFCSLLLYEGRTIVEVARQAGHAPSMSLDTYQHVIDELDGAERVPADERIRRARANLVPVSYPPSRGRAPDVAINEPNPW